MKKLIAIFLTSLGIGFAQPTVPFANMRISGTNNVVLDAASLKFGTTTPGFILGSAGSLSLTAQGTNQNLTLTPSGSGYVSLVGSGNSSNGLLNFPAGTTALQGIVAGTDTNFYRNAANQWRSDHALLLGTTTVATPRLQLAGTYNGSAWGTNGRALMVSSMAATDTSSSGTVATAVMTSFQPGSFVASNATTYTDVAGVYIGGNPTASTNVTITNGYGFWNVGKTRFDGNFLVTTGALSAFNVASGVTPFVELEVDSTSTSSPRGIMSAQFNTGTDGARFHGRKARGTRAAPTTVVSGDNLTRWVGSGYDGSNYLEMGSIIFGTEGTIAATRVPTNITFWTATNAAPSVLTLAGTVDSSQNWSLPNKLTLSSTSGTSAGGILLRDVPIFAPGSGSVSIVTTAQTSPGSTPGVYASGVVQLAGLAGQGFMTAYDSTAGSTLFSVNIGTAWKPFIYAGLTHVFQTNGTQATLSLATDQSATFAGDVVPGTDNAKDLGAANRWRKIVLGNGTSTTVGEFDFNRTGLAITPSDSVLVQNTTAAVVTGGLQVQMSPSISLLGNVWKSDATAASQTQKFSINNLPVIGAASTSAILQFQHSNNGAAATTPLTLTSAGTLTTAGGITSGSNVIATNAGFNISATGGNGFNTTGGGGMAFSGSGVLRMYNNGDTADVVLKFSTDSVLAIRTGNDGADAAITAGNFSSSGVIASTTDALTYASPTSVDVTLGNVYTVTTVNATGSVTFNATAGGTSGQRVTFIITNDATSAKTITFGTNFSSMGTLTPAGANKVATIEFVSNGTTLYEVCRSVIP